MGEMTDMVEMFGNNFQHIVWKTKDGRVMEIEDMTDKHLINAYLYIKRMMNNPKYDKEQLQETLEILEDEAEERGLSLI